MNQQIISEIFRTFDNQIVFDIGVAISKAYRANHVAFLEDNTLTCETAKDYRPHMLRTRADYFLEQINNPKIGTFVQFNENYSCRYLEIRIGNIVLTQNTVKSSEQPPRPANFRNKLQNQHGQLYLEFMNDVIEINQLNGLIYLQLIHGGNGDEPSFIKIGTELNKGEWVCYVDIPVINLNQKNTEEIDDARDPSLKEDKKTGEDDENGD